MPRSVCRWSMLVPLLVSGCTEPAQITSALVDESAITLPPYTVSVAMDNLNSPRGLAWGPQGALYVTEAGAAVSTGACAEVLEGAMLATKCYSGTGAVSRLWKGRQERVVSGLPSAFFVHNGFSAGPQDISFQGLGNAQVVLGWGGHPDVRSSLGPDAAELGSLVTLTPGGTWRVDADIAGFEAAFNPAGGPVDANPYGVLAESGRTYVVDAGGNSLLEVAPSGATSLVMTFPATTVPPPFMQADAVPTKVRRGPDGALYVSTLTGVPFLAGAAAVYRVVPGQPAQVYAGGFKTITDFAFGPDGSLYVVQFATAPVFFGGPGALIRIAPDGTRTTISTDLFQPTGVIAGADGSVYVSNNGTLTGLGQVLKFTP